MSSHSHSKRTVWTRRRILFITVVLVISALMFAYPVWHISQWLKLPNWLSILFTLGTFSSQIISRIVLRNRTDSIAYFLRRGADLLLGIGPLLLITTLLADILISWFNAPAFILARLIMAVCTLAGFYGVLKARNPEVVNVALNSPKLKSPIRFAQISDVHIGSRSKLFLERVMQQVVNQQPEFLCITGDFIDQPNISADQLKSLNSYNGPIYFCIGNHERYEDLDAIVRRLESLNVQVLRNKSVSKNGIQFIGIDDMEHISQVATQLPNFDIQHNHYVILLYHRPHGLEAAAEHGVDLMLSGHTHNGQIIPFNFAVKKIFTRAKGLHEYDKALLYVNEGTGTWGPAMRLGTRSEITLFEISPASIS